jgi:3-deoxy-7-phosphoheptulonate synthase
LAGSLRVDREGLALIAGPCSVEDRHQRLDVAHQVRAAGASALRGGAFKPRTRPHTFQGLKEQGLELLALAREETGLAIVTEVLDPRQVGLVARYADMLQIGARNMQNFPLLVAVGESGKPVLLKRGPAATMEEFLGAAEYVLQTGNSAVMLCERGIRTFEDHVRNTLPLASVPHLHNVTNLPVLVDPSHGVGRAELVLPLARAAVAVGADGLLIEVHPDPERALTDGRQSITPAAFARLAEECRLVGQVVGRRA